MMDEQSVFAIWYRKKEKEDEREGRCEWVSRLRAITLRENTYGRTTGLASVRLHSENAPGTASLRPGEREGEPEKTPTPSDLTGAY
jgi:hypothetical protein